MSKIYNNSKVPYGLVLGPWLITIYIGKKGGNGMEDLQICQ